MNAGKLWLTRRRLHNRELTFPILEQTPKLESSKVPEKHKLEPTENTIHQLKIRWLNMRSKDKKNTVCTYHPWVVRTIVRRGWSTPRCPWEFVWYSVTEDATWISKSNICSLSLPLDFIFLNCFRFFYKSHCFHMSRVSLAKSLPGKFPHLVFYLIVF